MNNVGNDIGKAFSNFGQALGCIFASCGPSTPPPPPPPPPSKAEAFEDSGYNAAGNSIFCTLSGRCSIAEHAKDMAMFENTASEGERFSYELDHHGFMMGGVEMPPQAVEGAELATKITADAIRAVMADAPLATKQGAVSNPVIQDYAARAAAGDVAPAIKVADGVIVEGNHRYIAGRLVGIEPAQTEGVMPPFKAAQPNVNWVEVFLDPTDWGNR